MSDEKKTVYAKMAEKTIAGQVVPKAVGAVCGVCVAKLTEDILDNLAPEPVNLGVKIMYGIGGVCVGMVAADYIEKTVELDLKNLSGSILMWKSFKTMVADMENSTEDKSN